MPVNHMHFFGNFFRQRPIKETGQEKKAMKRTLKRLAQNAGGAAAVEELVLIAAVTIPVAAALMGLGYLLLDYHKTIEQVLGLPIP